jgi:methionine synthase II (cobalamin-independent)
MTALPAVRGAHLVGSINQPTAAATLRVVAENLGTDIARIPDGEVGERYHWILFQGSAFDAVGGLVRVPIDPIVIGGFDVRPLTLDGTVAAEALEFGPLGYADAAIASFAEFSALKAAGVIAPGTRFQVSVPSPLAALSVYVVPTERPLVYPAYSAAIAREIAEITAAIPAGELAIQIDLATEFTYIEQVTVGGTKPVAWFAAAGTDSSTAEIITAAGSLAATIANAVPDAVELGFHLCYGDVAEKHFVEPADTENLVALANVLAASVNRPVNWVHLPVPIERDDSAYVAPLAGLALRQETKLFLGLVHHEDGVEGANRRIAAARPVLASAGITEFGIGTECGFGRGPADRTAPLLRLHAEIIAANA